jgi:hypothetical protein
MAYSIGAFEIAYILISIGIAIFGCSPIARSWDFYIPGSCVNKEAYFYAQAVFNIVTDFATLLLPIRMCLRLQLPTKQKWMLGLTFAVGSLYVLPSTPTILLKLFLLVVLTSLSACIVSIVRLVTLLPVFHNINFTVFKVNIAAWCEVEINTGIICSSLPCLKPIINRHFPPSMKNNSSAITSANVMGHVRAESDTSGEGWKEVIMHEIDADKREDGNEEERVAEEIKSRIRGWSVGERKEIGMGSVSEVYAEGSVVAEWIGVGSGEGILGGLEGKKSMEEMGGIKKTVVYDVRYESS